MKRGENGESSENQCKCFVYEGIEHEGQILWSLRLVTHPEGDAFCVRTENIGRNDKLQLSLTDSNLDFVHVLGRNDFTTFSRIVSFSRKRS